MTISFDEWRARSPFYDETHEAVAQSVRKFMAAEVLPNIDKWEADGELPRESVASRYRTLTTVARELQKLDPTVKFYEYNGA